MSSAWFMLYIQQMESNMGFKIYYTAERNKKVVLVIPGLFFADDLAVFANTRKDLQKMLNLIENQANNMKLVFNEKKS